MSEPAASCSKPPPKPSPPATRRAYAGAWERFKAWAGRKGLSSMPSPPRDPRSCDIPAAAAPRSRRVPVRIV